MNTFSFSPQEIIVTFVAILSSDFARYFIGAGGVYVTINLLLSRLLRHRKIRTTAPSQRQLASEILYSMRTVLVFACVGMSIWIGDRLGLMCLYSEPNLYGWGWFFASIIILILLHDSWFYWMHWLFHRSRVLRRFHVHHHLSNNPSPFTAYSFSIVEAILTALYFPLVLSVVPVSELAAFIFTAHMMLINAIHHCGYEIYPRKHDGTPLFDWLTTTTHHDLHHGNARWNFGFYFTHWDRWMGTEHPQYHEIFSQASASKQHSVRPVSTRHPHRWKLWMLGWIIAGTSFTAMLSIPSATAGEFGQSVEMRAVGGTWASEGYAFVVRFGPCDKSRTKLCGTLEWAWKPNAVAPEAWHRPMLQGFDFRDGYWRNGKLVHPGNGHIYRGMLHLQDKDSLILKGCFATLICDEQLWRRLNSLPHTTGAVSE